MRDDELSMDVKITDLTDDLLTVLDGHMDEMDMDQVFYESLKFMTMTMCDCLENDQKSLQVLRRAMDDGIIMYMDNKEK
jgi:hypothetical protein